MKLTSTSLVSGSFEKFDGIISEKCCRSVLLELLMSKTSPGCSPFGSDRHRHYRRPYRGAPRPPPLHTLALGRVSVLESLAALLLPALSVCPATSPCPATVFPLLGLVFGLSWASVGVPASPGHDSLALFPQALRSARAPAATRRMVGARR